jgi:hypothetical protein
MYLGYTVQLNRILRHGPTIRRFQIFQKNVSAFNIKREETGDPIPKIQQNLVGAVRPTTMGGTHVLLSSM